MRLLSPLPDSVDGTSVNIGRRSAPPTLITPSSIREADIAVPVTSRILFNLTAATRTSIAHRSNFAGDQVQVPGEVAERSQQGAVDFLQRPSPILTGSCLLYMSIFYF